MNIPEPIITEMVSHGIPAGCYLIVRHMSIPRGYRVEYGDDIGAKLRQVEVLPDGKTVRLVIAPIGRSQEGIFTRCFTAKQVQMVAKIMDDAIDKAQDKVQDKVQDKEQDKVQIKGQDKEPIQETNIEETEIMPDTPTRMLVATEEASNTTLERVRSEAVIATVRAIQESNKDNARYFVETMDSIGRLYKDAAQRDSARIESLEKENAKLRQQLMDATEKYASRIVENTEKVIEAQTQAFVAEKMAANAENDVGVSPESVAKAVGDSLDKVNETLRNVGDVLDKRNAKKETKETEKIVIEGEVTI